MNFSIHFSELVTANTNQSMVGYNDCISNTQRENCNTVNHSGDTNLSKTFNLYMKFSITKQNVMPGHEITESSIYILQDLNCMESLGVKRHGL
jgi:hypothetical protein